MSDLVPVKNFRTRMEAEVTAGLLGDAGIPYVIQSAEGSGIVPMPGGATLLVRPEDLVKAVRVLGYPKLVGDSES